MILHKIHKELLSLWETSVGSVALSESPQGEARDTFSFRNGTSRHSHLKCPKFRKAPQGEGDITDVNICKNPFCLGADGNLHSHPQSRRASDHQRPALESTRSAEGKGGSWAPVQNCLNRNGPPINVPSLQGGKQKASRLLSPRASCVD